MLRSSKVDAIAWSVDGGDDRPAGVGVGLGSRGAAQRSEPPEGSPSLRRSLLDLPAGGGVHLPAV